MAASISHSKSAPRSPIKPLTVAHARCDSFHVMPKVPTGDTPYVKAKNVQLVDRDLARSIPLFWAAINAGDRVDSALKDMAVVMKQQNRAEEAIEAIRSLRSRCSDGAQESLDNILLDLYKTCGRLDDHISLLKRRLFLIQQGRAFNGRRTKTARSQGKKFQVSIEQETTRLLGNLGWALMQKNNYIEAEAAYRKALLIFPDDNKMCNLGICLMKQGRIPEAKLTLQRVKPASVGGPRGVDSHLKAYQRAQEMLRDLESMNPQELFASSVWQPQPCTQNYADENFNSVNMESHFPMLQKNNKSIPQNSLNIRAPPLNYSTKLATNVLSERTTRDHHLLGGDDHLKRTRSVSTDVLQKARKEEIPEERSTKSSPALFPAPAKEAKEADDIIWPDDDEFQEAIMAAAAFYCDTSKPNDYQTKVPKRRKSISRDSSYAFEPSMPELNFPGHWVA